MKVRFLALSSNACASEKKHDGDVSPPEERALFAERVAVNPKKMWDRKEEKAKSAKQTEMEAMSKQPCASLAKCKQRDMCMHV